MTFKKNPVSRLSVTSAVTNRFYRDIAVTGHRDSLARAGCGYTDVTAVTVGVTPSRAVTPVVPSLGLGPESRPVAGPVDNFTRVEPWPNYDEQGNPWWTVRVGAKRRVVKIGYSSRGMRWARGADFARLQRKFAPFEIAVAEAYLREALPPC